MRIWLYIFPVVIAVTLVFAFAAGCNTEPKAKELKEVIAAQGYTCSQLNDVLVRYTLDGDQPSAHEVALALDAGACAPDCPENAVAWWVADDTRECIALDDLLETEGQRLAVLVRHYALEQHEMEQLLVDTEHALAEAEVTLAECRNALANAEMATHDAVVHLQRQEAELAERILTYLRVAIAKFQP